MGLFGTPLPKREKPFGPIVLNVDGLEYRAWDMACICGHWASAHSGDGMTKCQGFRCGCYTFRWVGSNKFEPGSIKANIQCNVCGQEVATKRVRLDDYLTTSWLHVDPIRSRTPDDAIIHTESKPIPVQVSHLPVCAPGDCGCGLGDDWRPGDPVKKGAGTSRFMTRTASDDTKEPGATDFIAARDALRKALEDPEFLNPETGAIDDPDDFEDLREELLNAGVKIMRGELRTAKAEPTRLVKDLKAERMAKEISLGRAKRAPLILDDREEV